MTSTASFSRAAVVARVSRPNASTTISPPGIRQVAAETSLPAFVIGGVTLETVGAVVAAGGRRVAVSRAVCAADDPRLPER